MSAASASQLGAHASPIGMAGDDPLLLLEILCALLDRDGGPVGVEAEVAIGVETAAGARWLYAKLGRVCHAEIVEREPAAEGSLYLGRQEALALMSAAEVPARPRVEPRGRTWAIVRLIERYVGPQGWLAARAVPAS